MKSRGYIHDIRRNGGLVESGVNGVDGNRVVGVSCVARDIDNNRKLAARTGK